jgi:hypothetical protein
MTQDIPLSHRLENRLRHPCFRQPEDPNAKVWRYMDLPKFIWLLKHDKLYVTRLDRLGDPYEGSLTANTIKGIDLFLRQRGVKDGWAGMSKFYRQNQATTYACCWHMNRQESEAMWRLYCGKGHGVAIQSSYAHLVSAIETEHEMYVGCVKYVDYDADWFPDANAYHPVMHKRLAFEHEHEVRLVASPSQFRASPPETAPDALFFLWSNDARVEGIFVDPYAPEYFFEAVKSIVEALAPTLMPRLVWSQMKAAPVF